MKCPAVNVYSGNLVVADFGIQHIHGKVYFDTLLLTDCTKDKLIEAILPTIQTDRPDQTECPFIVPANHFQIENGLNYEQVSVSEMNYFYPSTLWKYGVNDNLEFRLITELNTNKCNEIKTSGLNPVKVGFKTNLCKEKGIVPLTSFIGHISIPTLASNKFKTSFLAPSFRFTMQHTLTNKITLGYNLGAEWDGENPEPVFIYTLTTGFSCTDKIGTYIEFYGFAPNLKQFEHRTDGGITYNLSRNILLDVSGGFGLSESAPNYYASLGFSIRFPN